MTKYLILLSLIFSIPGLASGQQQYMPEVRKVLSNFLSTGNISYDYTLSVTFPDNSRDELKGSSFFDKASGVSLNDCNAVTSFYTKDWFYKANHNDKTVFVVNLGAKENAELRKSIEQQLFKNGLLSEFLDSIVFSKGMIRDYTSGTDTIRAELVFPRNMSVKKVQFSYNPNSGLFYEYRMELFFPTEQDGDRIKGSTQKITCTNFLRETDNERFRPSTYFTRSKEGKIILKKYADYKLNPEL